MAERQIIDIHEYWNSDDIHELHHHIINISCYNYCLIQISLLASKYSRKVCFPTNLWFSSALKASSSLPPAIPDSALTSQSTYPGSIPDSMKNFLCSSNETLLCTIFLPSITVKSSATYNSLPLALIHSRLDLRASSNENSSGPTM